MILESFKDFAQFSVLDPCHNAPEWEIGVYQNKENAIIIWFENEVFKGSMGAMNDI